MSASIMYALSTVLAMVAFAAVCWWAYTPANRRRFEEDAYLALETDPIFQQKMNQATSTHMASSTPELSEKP